MVRASAAAHHILLPVNGFWRHSRRQLLERRRARQTIQETRVNNYRVWIERGAISSQFGELIANRTARIALLMFGKDCAIFSAQISFEKIAHDQN